MMMMIMMMMMMMMTMMMMMIIQIIRTPFISRPDSNTSYTKLEITSFLLDKSFPAITHLHFLSRVSLQSSFRSHDDYRPKYY